MLQITPDEVLAIKTKLEGALDQFGYEFHPFKVAWYNSLINPAFKINYNEDTLAFLIVSTPKMFEKGFVPFLRNEKYGDIANKDPMNLCSIHYLSQIVEMFPEYADVKVILDFELYRTRRPKIVLQCLAHVSGAAYFYHPSCISNPEWNERTMYGASIHPKYGGWFDIRAAAFFEDLTCPDLPQSFPYDVVPNIENRIRLLELYNIDDWSYRDIIPVAEKFSDLQIQYLSTPPENKNEIIQQILKSNISNDT